MCITPTTLKRAYKTLDNSHTDIVPCGKCHECLSARQKSWAFRLMQQTKISDTACFITLTYENTPISSNGFPTLNKKHLQDFWKRLRKHSPNVKIKYYAAGEYAPDTMRPHYHAIVFNMRKTHIQNSIKFAEKIWTHGLVDIGTCTIRSTMYTASYIMKGTWKPQFVDTETGEIDDRQPEYATQSKNLGLNYLTPQMVQYHIDGMIPYITNQGGHLQLLPRYYKDKIFSKLERKQLAKDAQAFRELSLEDYLNFDYEMEVQQKKDGIRRHNLLKTKHAKI